MIFDASASPTDTTVMPTVAVRGRRFRIADLLLRLLCAGGWLDDGTSVPAPTGLSAFFPAAFLLDAPCSAERTAKTGVAGVTGSHARVAGPLRTGVGVSTTTPFPAFLLFFLELTPTVLAMEAVPAGVRSTAPRVEATCLGMLAPFLPDAVSFIVFAARLESPARGFTEGTAAPPRCGCGFWRL